MSDGAERRGRRKNRWKSWWNLLLLIPFAGTLWVPSYNALAPLWHGIPFFYWYQFLWILISALLTAIVYLLTDR